MAHNLDITDGVVSYVGAREDAWHKLGTTLPEEFTAEQAMEHGHLGGWNVRKEPAFTRLSSGLMVPMPGQYGIVRDNPVTKDEELLAGAVGEAYRPIQNEEHAAFLDALVDESGAHFSTAGALDGGRRVFITMKLPGHIKIGGVDKIENYIAAVNSHDGSSAFTLMVTPVRIVCQNTEQAALYNNSHMFKIRHTHGATAAVNEARKALDLAFAYLDEFQEMANRLIDTELTFDRFSKIITREFGPDDDSNQIVSTRRLNKVRDIESLFSAQTQEGVKDTCWAGYNAMTEWFDHMAPNRDQSDKDLRRAVSAITDTKFKERAFDLMMDAAGIMPETV